MVIVTCATPKLGKLASAIGGIWPLAAFSLARYSVRTGHCCTIAPVTRHGAVVTQSGDICQENRPRERTPWKNCFIRLPFLERGPLLCELELVPRAFPSMSMGGA